jgi:hypothetical protein
VDDKTVKTVIEEEQSRAEEFAKSFHRSSPSVRLLWENKMIGQMTDGINFDCQLSTVN